MWPQVSLFSPSFSSPARPGLAMLSPKTTHPTCTPTPISLNGHAFLIWRLSFLFLSSNPDNSEGWNGAAPLSSFLQSQLFLSSFINHHVKFHCPYLLLHLHHNQVDGCRRLKRSRGQIYVTNWWVEGHSRRVGAFHIFCLVILIIFDSFQFQIRFLDSQIHVFESALVKFIWKILILGSKSASKSSIFISQIAYRVDLS